MYAPSHFRVDDEAAALRLFSEVGFATLTTVVEGRAVISHIPMLADPARRVLRGHLARANPHAALIERRTHLVSIIGPNAYVSPDWYSDLKQVPTWNYLAVHVEGVGRVLTEPDAVDAVLDELSAHHEARRADLADGKIWELEKLPPEKLRKLRTAIVAFEIDIEKIDFKAKLSQNKGDEDFDRVTRKLAEGGEGARGVAAAMRALKERR
ncbi:MAG TPA: FMN-binding negative transcriptional regulator [Parvularculaceae bacterium]|nr:FMN-binding negative transcriptional regulator [Parvularculaceae bacterium]